MKNKNFFISVSEDVAKAFTSRFDAGDEGLSRTVSAILRGKFVGSKLKKVHNKKFLFIEFKIMELEFGNGKYKVTQSI